MNSGSALGPLARVELPCRDPRRLRDFYGRILGLPLSAGDSSLRFSLGVVELVLRQRGDVLFPFGQSDAGILLAFPIADAELDRLYRRMLTLRVAVLDAPGPTGAPPRLLRLSDPEGNVVELFAAPAG
ncbi:VOC family protein [Belnapia sp. T6]|uniref:VOC family protein n=1 Tax=Belnapia mucosa TaxID=2804532 RepID=A0ABS1V4W4_9PROT|nr:VOC family protein [Belnapia mucosa]MBL6456737.1 VOC family protein [Belnapia mucosa]